MRRMFLIIALVLALTVASGLTFTPGEANCAWCTVRDCKYQSCDSGCVCMAGPATSYCTPSNQSP